MPPGKLLVFLGLGLIIAGLFLSYGGRIPLLGKLPGDLRIQRENFSFYFPLASCLLVSAVLSLIFWLFRR
ncbi:DUF2905 domain-containing protein [Trichloromonas sp.]|uniref:DUF2905 domain-containing protein n=1 Tax=Trichloromonas sp. TaxID=3069249 RepID=UPI003D818746